MDEDTVFTGHYPRPITPSEANAMPPGRYYVQHAVDEVCGQVVVVEWKDTTHGPLRLHDPRRGAMYQADIRAWEDQQRQERQAGRGRGRG